MTARAILERAEELGLELILEPEDRLRVRGAQQARRQLVPLLKEHKAAVLAELRRKTAPFQKGGAQCVTITPDGFSRTGRLCAACLRIMPNRIVEGREFCEGCWEWRVSCPTYTTLNDVDAGAEARTGACLSCSGSWDLHGRPERNGWRRVHDFDDLELLEIRYLIAKATAITREATR